MEQELFNHDQKQRFLEDFQGDTKDRYFNILMKAKLSESILGKDLYDFNSTEIKDIIISTDATSINSVMGYVSLYRNYIRWSIKNGLSKSNINPLDHKDSKFYDALIDTNKKIFITEDELIEIEDNILINFQDRVCWRLLYEGLSLDELINLKKTDIDYKEKTINLPKREGSKFIKISNRALKIIEGANKELDYNLYVEEVNAPVAFRPLKDNIYVVRSLSKKNRVNDDEKSNYTTIRNRVQYVKKNYFSFITTKNISKSGMLKLAKDIFITKGKLEQQDVNHISDVFGFSYFTTYVNGEPYRYPNTQAVRKAITEEAIKRVYNI